MVYDAARKVRPVVEDPLDAYATAIEEGVDPEVAWDHAFGSEDDAGVDAAPDAEAERYTLLLEAGWSPPEAWSGSFGAKGGLVAKRLSVGLSDSYTSTEWTTATLATRVTTVSEEGVMSGYRSMVYEVTYMFLAPGEAYERVFRTFLRLDVPDGFTWSWGVDGALPLVLLVAGGSSIETAVRNQESDEPQATEKGYLASGTSAPAPGTGMPFVLDGPSMAVASFSHPGRGVQDEATGEYLRADGNGWERSTPANTDGQDYGGDLTMAAMDAVMEVTLTILGFYRRLKPHFVEEADPWYRLVVFSYSDGLSSASRWVAQTDLEVHALVDYEGPPASMERAGCQRYLSEVTDPADELPDIDWDTWKTRFEVDPDEYFYRPPVDVLEDLAACAGWPIVANATGVDEDIWATWYDDPTLTASALADELTEFWRLREAATHLPALAGKLCAYVRIQNYLDHSPGIDWLRGRKAIRCLDAAFESDIGEHPNVYYTDVAFSEKAIDEVELLSDPSPTRMTGTWDDANSVGNRSGWPEWPRWKSTDLEWRLAVGLVRWAMTASFTWFSRGEEPDSSGSET